MFAEAVYQFPLYYHCLGANGIEANKENKKLTVASSTCHQYRKLERSYFLIQLITVSIHGVAVAISIVVAKAPSCHDEKGKETELSTCTSTSTGWPNGIAFSSVLM